MTTNDGTRSLIYQYHFQNMTIWERSDCYGRYTDFTMDREGQRFITLYAKEFTNVTLPDNCRKPQKLDTREVRKIGKAMLTHHLQEIDADTESTQRHNKVAYSAKVRARIIERMGCDIHPGYISGLWNVESVFLFGEDIWLQCFEIECYGYHTGSRFASRHDERYREVIPEL